MANEQNLIPIGERSENEQREMRSKGGINSGKSRGQKANIRKAVQNILNNSYTNKDGSTVSGVDALAVNLFQIAMDKKNKNCITAMKMLLDLYGENMSPEEKRKLKAETDLIKAKIKAMQGGDDFQFENELPMLYRALESDDDDV